MLKHFKPLQPDPYIIEQADMGLVKFGHLNAVIDYLSDSNITDSTNVTSTTTGAGNQWVTTFTFDALAIGTVPSASNRALGVKLGTLPAGAAIVAYANMSVALNGVTAIIADTPDVGIGTTIGSGNVAVLGGTAAFENIITGQTAANANGGVTNKTIAGTPLAIESASSHDIFLNIADGWATGGGAITATGTVSIAWILLN